MHSALFLMMFLAAKPAAVNPTAVELSKLKARVMSADYRADLPELTALRDELIKWPKDRELAYAARYWAGYASWRIAMNGANHQMKPDDLLLHLRNAATQFYISMALKDDFADSVAAASLVNGWLATFNMEGGPFPDRPPMEEHAALSRALVARATALDPDNPRVLWARAAFLLYAPPSMGGSVPRAIDLYQQMLRQAEKRGTDPTSPLPDWGKPEALMSLAFAHTMLTPPELEKAREEADAALKAQPDWSYVRDNLIPLIAQKISAASGRSQ